VAGGEEWAGREAREGGRGQGLIYLRRFHRESELISTAEPEIVVPPMSCVGCHFSTTSCSQDGKPERSADVLSRLMTERGFTLVHQVRAGLAAPRSG
jgi:hypothetical protein